MQLYCSNNKITELPMKFLVNNCHVDCDNKVIYNSSVSVTKRLRKKYRYLKLLYRWLVYKVCIELEFNDCSSIIVKYLQFLNVCDTHFKLILWQSSSILLIYVKYVNACKIGITF